MLQINDLLKQMEFVGYESYDEISYEDGCVDNYTAEVNKVTLNLSCGTLDCHRDTRYYGDIYSTELNYDYYVVLFDLNGNRISLDQFDNQDDFMAYINIMLDGKEMI